MVRERGLVTQPTLMCTLSVFACGCDQGPYPLISDNVLADIIVTIYGEFRDSSLQVHLTSADYFDPEEDRRLSMFISQRPSAMTHLYAGLFLAFLAPRTMQLSSIPLGLHLLA